jgi:hypothetical protein
MKMERFVGAREGCLWSPDNFSKCITCRRLINMSQEYEVVGPCEKDIDFSGWEGIPVGRFEPFRQRCRVNGLNIGVEGRYDRRVGSRRLPDGDRHC